MSESTHDKVGSDPALFAGMLTEKQLEEQTGWRDRTRRRQEARGLPVIVVGTIRLYPVDKVRDWIMSHLREREAPRRGRPKKVAA